MRTHTTKTLKELVLDKLDPLKYTLSEHECDVWLQSLPEIEREMMETMDFFTCHLFDKGMKNRQYQQIHRECIYLLDKADKLGMLEGKAEEVRLGLIACVDAISARLLADFTKYIELDHLMPVIHLRRDQARISSGMTALSSMFDALGLDKKVQKEVLFCMSEVSKGKRCFYTRMMYVKSLMEGLLELCPKSSKSVIAEDLLHFLVERNYNTEGFVRCYKNFVSGELAARLEDAEKSAYLEHLEWQLRSRTYRKGVYRYDDTRTNVKHVLHDFVFAELSTVKQRIHAAEAVLRDAHRASEISPGVRLLETVKPVVPYKIRTAMTVDMLAYFIKLMVQAKVIEPGVKMELMNFAAAIFQTPGTGVAGIAPGSLYTKYRQAVQNTAKSVRVLVRRMLKDIDDEFGKS